MPFKKRRGEGGEGGVRDGGAPAGASAGTAPVIGCWGVEGRGVEERGGEGRKGGWVGRGGGWVGREVARDPRARRRRRRCALLNGCRRCRGGCLRSPAEALPCCRRACAPPPRPPPPLRTLWMPPSSLTALRTSAGCRCGWSPALGSWAGLPLPPSAAGGPSARPRRRCCLQFCRRRRRRRRRRGCRQRWGGLASVGGRGGGTLPPLGADVVLHAVTGSGKTLVYLPALVTVEPWWAAVQALVVVPTHELGMQL